MPGLNLDEVIPAGYPELATLAWNRDPRKPITGVVALSLYERNWRHLRPDAFTPQEAELSSALAERFGAGILLK